MNQQGSQPGQPAAPQWQQGAPQWQPGPGQGQPQWQPPQKQPNWFVRHKVWTGIFVAIVLIVIISAAANGGKSKSNTSTAPASSAPAAAPAIPAKPSPAAAPAPPPAPPTTPAPPRVLLNQSGTGIQTLAPFQVSGSWTLKYTFDCASFGSAGNFAVDVNTDKGGLVFADTGPNLLAMNGNSSTYMPQGGNLSLSINSECNWTVQAVQP